MQAQMPRGGDAKVQAKLRKLMALAERGEGGEKDNAQRMLDNLLARHGLTLDDLNEECREIRWFPIVTVYDRKLATQIMSKVCDTCTPGLYTSKSRPKKVGVEVTPAEAIEFELHFDTLRNALAAHFDEAFSAFVQANRLFPASPSGSRDTELSESDMRVVAMASAIKPTSVRPRLERKGKV